MLSVTTPCLSPPWMWDRTILQEQKVAPQPRWDDNQCDQMPEMSLRTFLVTSRSNVPIQLQQRISALLFILLLSPSFCTSGPTCTMQQMWMYMIQQLEQVILNAALCNSGKEIQTRMNTKSEICIWYISPEKCLKLERCLLSRVLQI